MRRSSLIAAVLMLSSVACDGSDPDLRSVHIGISDHDAARTTCYALRLEDAAGASWLDVGLAATAQPSLAAARAAGDLCETEGSLADVELDHACTASGPQTARVWIGGTFDAAGAPLDTSDSCGAGGCTRAFECPEADAVEVEVDVGFTFTLMTQAHQGFIDVNVNGTTVAAESGAPMIFDACYAIRIANGADGSMVFGRSGICATEFGNNTAAVAYITPCDAAAGDTEVSVWLESVKFGDHVPEAERVYGNPCPAPSDGSDIATWKDGCSLHVTCEEDRDKVVSFELDLRSTEP